MKLTKREARGVVILFLLFILIFFCVALFMKIQFPKKITIISDNKIPYDSDKSVMVESCDEKSPELTEYVYVEGTSLFLNGEEYIIQGVCASNGVAASPEVYDVDMMSEDDYKEISSLGMNTVRFLFNYNLLEDDSNPYVYKDAGWEWIDMNLEWAEKYGVHVILDCHLSQGGIPATGGNSYIWTVGEEKQERLVAMWKAIAERYCNNTTVLGYGLVNEPTIDTNKESDWSALANRLRDTIRSVDKNHVLFVQRAFLEKDRSYVYPELEDNNWVLEIHKYPSTDMRFVKAFYELPEDYFYYGNDTIVARRKNATEKETLEYSVYNNRDTKISNEWTEYSFTFTAPEGSNHAYLLFEILNLKDAQKISICDVSISKRDGREIYNLIYNIGDEYTSYSSMETAKIDYLSSQNIISVRGASNYVTFADNSYFRFFKLEEKQEYILKFKLRAEPGLDINTYVNTKIKCYDAEKIYMLNKEFLDYLLNGEELSECYEVPIYYGEVGIDRNAYNENRGIDLLSADMLSWLVDNKCNFTWFAWHEPNYGIYTSSGLEMKENPNILLMEQFERVLINK